MSDRLEDVKRTLINPDLIISHKYDENKRNYYLHYKLTKDYLLVSVRYLNGGGYIVTAFITKKLVKR